MARRVHEPSMRGSCTTITANGSTHSGGTRRRRRRGRANHESAIEARTTRLGSSPLTRTRLIEQLEKVVEARGEPKW